MMAISLTLRVFISVISKLLPLAVMSSHFLRHTSDKRKPPVYQEKATKLHQGAGKLFIMWAISSVVNGSRFCLSLILSGLILLASCEMSTGFIGLRVMYPSMSWARENAAVMYVRYCVTVFLLTSCNCWRMNCLHVS